MLRTLGIIAVLSVVAIIFMPFFSKFLAQAHVFYLWVNHLLSLVINGGNLARLIRELLAIILIPLLLALVPAFLYWIFTRREMPYFASLIWTLWLMLITMLALHS